MKNNQGSIIVLSLVITSAVLILLAAFLGTVLAERKNVERSFESTQALHLAEAGVARAVWEFTKVTEAASRFSGWTESGDSTTITLEQAELDNLGQCTTTVSGPSADNPVILSTAAAGSYQIEKTIRLEVTKSEFLAAPYEYALYAESRYETPWAYELRGNDDLHWSGGKQLGGQDIVDGDIYIQSYVGLYEHSEVNPPDPNNYSLQGDVESTFPPGSIYQESTATVAGSKTAPASAVIAPNLIDTYYAWDPASGASGEYDLSAPKASVISYDVAQEFADEGTDWYGWIPTAGHPLHNSVRMDPLNGSYPYERTAECASTTGHDYFFETHDFSTVGAPLPGDASYPLTNPSERVASDVAGYGIRLELGGGKVYFVDGDVWFQAHPSYTITIKGKATIVATGDIHISDNIIYEDSESMLGLVALGKWAYEGEGAARQLALQSGGNIWFGDPAFGTLYRAETLMLAANDFYYSTDSTTGGVEQPDTGFDVYGNLCALNQINIAKDWFDDGHWEEYWRWSWWTGWYKDTRWVSDWQPAQFDPIVGGVFDPENGQWKKLDTEEILTQDQINTLRHYRMGVGYDDRIRDLSLQPPGLPLGGGHISAGFSINRWSES